jgi:proteasome accessory factor A
MAERLLGVETEYALTGFDASGKLLDREFVLRQLMRTARDRYAHLSDTTGRGVFLANGARFYIDVPDHPEFTTPECPNPWDVVRYIQAGERILAGLATDLRGRRIAEVVILRSNVDYSGTGSTWGTHESFQHRSSPRALPSQIIPHLVSRVIYTGAGGFNSRFLRGIEFTLSPRVPHLETEISEQSMHSRGIFHTKDESLSSEGYHRLHILCGESVCSEIAAWLKVGTTAIVVALIEAGLRPGDAVHLRSPLAAMRCFASDPTCRAAAPSTTGTTLTALEIQRHYLEMAETHLQAASMPPWAGLVCREWRAMLCALEAAPDSVATTLDWAIKLALFKQRSRQRGITWEELPHWNHVVTKLSEALDRAGWKDERPSVDVILDERGPVADEVRRLTPYLSAHRLRWDALRAFIELRQELFEIDTRFGQLGDTGIFTGLERAGVLTHRVNGIDNIEHAVEHPPAAGRARVRGRYVRELSGAGKRYECDWQGIWDHQKHLVLDLSDPFAASAQWQSHSASAEESSWDSDFQGCLFPSSRIAPF